MGRRRGVVGGLVLAIGLAGATVTAAKADAGDGVPRLTDPAAALLRTICDLQWVDGTCDRAGFADPQYRTGVEPHADQPLVARIGVVHEHSGYSDGDPTSRPADYFRAAREGHDRADDGTDRGVIVDFLLSSEHSENEKLPVTTAMACLDPPAIPSSTAGLELARVLPALACAHPLEGEHLRKWDETLRQAVEATEVDDGGYAGFTAMRGFEYTNDLANHLGVYFSRNVRNAKIDGSYASTDAFWRWLATPPERGGGSDALVVFNHPGVDPNLTPLDDGAVLGPVLQALLGSADWHDQAYVPAADAQVSGIEVDGGDDLQWYQHALGRGWHVGPIGHEDEHQREWSSSAKDKTVLVTRGRSPRDYYAALRQHRTMAYRDDVVAGAPGTPARYPAVSFWADGASINSRGAAPLGARLRGGRHVLELAASGLAPGSTAVLVRDGGGRTSLGRAGPDGRLRASHAVTAPAEGESWWFAVVCGPDSARCGVDDRYDVVTAPIWVRAAG